MTLKIDLLYDIHSTTTWDICYSHCMTTSTTELFALNNNYCDGALFTISITDVDSLAAEDRLHGSVGCVIEKFPPGIGLETVDDEKSKSQGGYRLSHNYIK